MNNGYRIVVDAGHGGSDPGAVSGNFREKDFNLKAANYMYNRFKELGVPVTITRSDDTTLSRTERINKMKSLGTDSNVIVLSNHINAGNGEGAEVVYPLRTSATLPSMILDEIGKRGQIKRKYYQRVLPENPSKDYYYIMRETPNTTALLIEYGFIDNFNDQRKLQNNLLDYVEGVVEAVSNYIGINYVPPGKNITETDGLYTVKKGDTLYSIAKKYNVSVDELISYNELPTSILRIGQVLRIPSIKVSDLVYTVKSGDTLYKIANNYGVSIDDIKQLNNLTSNILSIGQELYIPEGNTIEETDYIVYQVGSGDTLYKIAKEYNTTPDAIKDYNNLTNDILSIGQTLQIPYPSIKTENAIYVVRRGDTLYQIANRYGVTVSEIMNLNNKNTTLINIGDTLLIPNRPTEF
ncbi:MAG: LysM peptidoglycan-binding domain-containing protein [Bacilli bacterium]|nr:LysM peptidoglycan-binding domain-containing protein [Bacilli bacterium]